MLDAFSQQKEILGKGSYGDVKEVRWFDEATQSIITVAVKRQVVSIDPSNRSIDRELEMLKKVKGVPGVIQMITCMQNEEPVKVKMGRVFFTPRRNIIYMIFPRLHRTFASESIELSQGKGVFKAKSFIKRLEVYLEITQALVGLHSKDIVHSDIKPDNIMITDEDISGVVIVDLGLADLAGQKHHGHSVFYSPIEGRMRDSLQLPFDVYSLGGNNRRSRDRFIAYRGRARRSFKGYQIDP